MEMQLRYWLLCVIGILCLSYAAVYVERRIAILENRLALLPESPTLVVPTGRLAHTQQTNSNVETFFSNNPTVETPAKIKAPNSIQPLQTIQKPVPVGTPDNVGTINPTQALKVTTQQPVLKGISSLDVSHFPVLEYPTACSTTAQPQVLWYLYNMPDNFQRRMYIRKTYSNQTRFPSQLLRQVFVFGRMKNETKQMEETIRKEANAYGDILYADFVEDYHNLTFKAGIILNYVASHCHGVKYIVKSDDDTIINVESIVQKLRRHHPSSLYITGQVFANNMPVIRDADGPFMKWYVSPEDFPLRQPDVYPTYCSGTGFGLTATLFRELQRRISREPRLWVDDAYVTGVLGEHIKGITWETFPKIASGAQTGLRDLHSAVLTKSEIMLPRMITMVNSDTEYDIVNKKLLDMVQILGITL